MRHRWIIFAFIIWATIFAQVEFNKGEDVTVGSFWFTVIQAFVLVPLSCLLSTMITGSRELCFPRLPCCSAESFWGAPLNLIEFLIFAFIGYAIWDFADQGSWDLVGQCIMALLVFWGVSEPTTLFYKFFFCSICCPCCVPPEMARLDEQDPSRKLVDAPESDSTVAPSAPIASTDAV